MKHGSLFSGIGGFDLAAQWMGWENVFHCENNSYCQKVLKRLFPNSISHGNIKTTDFSIYRGFIGIISGGDPCQPHSVAGLGKGTSDDRYLWPQYDRAVEEIRPPWVVNENVSGSVANGVLDIKINDLERKGYSCQAYSIPAEAVGALHQRERIWLIAYNANFHADNKITGRISAAERKKSTLEREQYQIYQSRESIDLRIVDTYTNPERFEEQHLPAFAASLQKGVSRYFGFGTAPHGNITRHVIESGIIRMLNGLPEGMDYADRNQRIKALGNAIVPQVAYEIFKAIEQFETATA
jgi:DNA (cytosine-5)-methyltransferase 1